MPGRLSMRTPGAVQTIEELRSSLGLFSFQNATARVEHAQEEASWSQIAVRSGGIAEWLVAKEGAGAATLALQVMVRSLRSDALWAVVDSSREFYLPAFSGWGIDPGKILVLRPTTIQETCWSIEQCLRCPDVSGTLAWLDRRIPARVHRRWQMAAEVGGGIALFFRPVQALRDPTRADLRLLVTPVPGGRGDTRRLNIEVLYRRGGLGGCPQVWEIDHASGLVRLVPQVAHSTTTHRATPA